MTALTSAGNIFGSARKTTALKRAAEEYFTWKLANSSEATVEREKRIFKPVEKFFASDFRVKAITLAHT